MLEVFKESIFWGGGSVAGSLNHILMYNGPYKLSLILKCQDQIFPLDTGKRQKENVRDCVLLILTYFILHFFFFFFFLSGFQNI